MSRRVARAALLLVPLLAGCEGILDVADATVTGIRLTAEYSAALDQFRITLYRDGEQLFEPRAIPEEPGPLAPGRETLVLLLPDDLDGAMLLVRVDGLEGGERRASGETEATIQVGELVDATVSLGSPTECGDGVVQAQLEECDDRNTVSGDGCTASCDIEDGYECRGEPSVCWTCGDETCDDGEDVCNCPADCTGAECGDGSCCRPAGENPCSCPDDCGVTICGDGLCCVGEESTCSCQIDCGVESCGNAICCDNIDPPETALTCADDCATGCGDGACLEGEDPCNCPEDCGVTTCDDGFCCAEQDEDTCTCPDDCGLGNCGDTICCAATEESPCTCPADCGENTCNDGTCCPGDGENPCTCADDCGASACDDGICCTAAGEDIGNCPQDCDIACDDGKCVFGEDVCTCPADCDGTTCGDGSCCDQGGENPCTCALDCGASECGDGVCCAGRGENQCTCALDCGDGTCGDGICCAAADENKCTCEADCGAGTCGDGVCCADTSETTCTCPGDCGAGTCSDGICCAAEDENKCTCPDDCGASECSDGVCCAAAGENTCTCSDDCGQSQCGDTICCAATNENPCECPADCGQGECGDGVCCAATGEDQENCALDCLETCGNDTCDTGEDVCNCAHDCSDATCGDGRCCAAGNEDACTCSDDCGASTCDDGICCATQGEDRCTCEADCGAGTCNDGICCAGQGEDRCTCPDDCGAGSCDDGVCCATEGENKCSCEADCGASECNDGVCCEAAGEDACTCSDDCGQSECGDTICCEAQGETEIECPEDCGAGCLNLGGSLWFSTFGDVTGSGVAGLDAWTAGQVLSLGDPGLALEPGTSAGTVAVELDLDLFVEDGDALIDGLHLVERAIRVGGAGAAGIELQPGDVLVSFADAETGASPPGLAISDRDIIAFQPIIPGDYSAGNLTIVIDGSAAFQADVKGLTLVEADTQVGDALLEAGSFLVTQESVVHSKYVYHYSPSSVGDGSTAGTRSIFITSKDLGVPNKHHLDGIEVTEACRTLDGLTIPGGQLLVSAEVDATVGGLPVVRHDVFYISLTSTVMGGGTTAGQARMVLQGLDLGLDDDTENPSSLSLY